MAILKTPDYVLEYTLRTVDSVLSAAALEGKEVEVDVYDRKDVSKKFVGTGYRMKGEGDMFRIRVETETGSHEDEWNYTILRDSAGRARKMKR